MRSKLILPALFIALLSSAPTHLLAQPTSSTARRIAVVASLPASCAKGDVAYQTSDSTFYGCTLVNTWAAFTPGGAAGANTALSNLAAVAVNAVLKPATAAALDLGTTALPWASLYLAGTSGTPATNRFLLTGASTGGLRTITMPDASGTLSLQGGSPLGVGASIVIQVTNEGATGTTANRLVRITSAGAAIVTSDTTDAIGICVSGCGTTGSAIIAVIGQATCVFSGATTAQNYVGVGASGQCTDLGSTFPTGVMVIGRVQSTNGGAGSYTTTLFLPDTASAASGGNGRGQSVRINGTNAPGNIVNFNSATPAPGAGFLATTYATSQSGAVSSVISKVAISGDTTTVTSMGAGDPATNDCAKFDANNNLVSAGAACGTGSGSSAVDKIRPITSVPVTGGSLWPGVYTGAGTGQKYSEGMFLADSTTVAADATWALEFPMPATLPSGTCKLLIISQANAAANALKVNPKWASVADAEDPSSATLNAEGTTTITWAAGDADDYKFTKITLDATTPTASEIIVMNLVWEDSGMTLAVNSLHKVYVIFE